MNAKESASAEKPDAPPEGEAPDPPPRAANGGGRGSMDPDEIARSLEEFMRQAQGGGAPPGPDEEPVSREDIQLRRKHGRPHPLKVRTPLQGLVVEIVPLKWGVGREMRLAHRGLQDLSDEELIQIVREHVVTPDLSDADLAWAEENMDWVTPLDLASAVIQHSRSTYRMEIPNVEEVTDEEEGKD